MTAIHIDGLLALSLIAQAVNLKGADHVDARSANGQVCKNVDVEVDRWGNEIITPSCIVGTALALAGIPVTELRSCDGSWSSKTGEHLVRKGLLTVDKAASVAFDRAQRTQDKAGTWGFALQVAAGVANPDVLDDWTVRALEEDAERLVRMGNEAKEDASL